jgi:hypothetical protein
MVVSVGLNAIQARSVQQMFRKLNNEAQDEIREMLIDIAADETFATIKRMEAKSKGQGDIYDRVADGVDFDLVEGAIASNIPTIRFGVSSRSGRGDFKGMRGSRGANIAALLAFGKAQSTPLDKGIYVKRSPGMGPASQDWAKEGRGIGGGYQMFSLFLRENYVSKAREGDDSLLLDAMMNIQADIEKNIPAAIQRAYGNKRITIDGRVSE